MKKSKKIIKTILVLPLVLGLFFSSLSSFVFASQTGTIVATVSINPLSLKIFAPSKVWQGRTFRLMARIENLGQREIEEVKATIFVPPGLTVEEDEEEEVGEIDGRRKKMVSWRIKADESDSYVIQVEARGIVAETGDLVTRSETATVEVRTRISFWNVIRRFLARA